MWSNAMNEISGTEFPERAEPALSLAPFGETPPPLTLPVTVAPVPTTAGPHFLGTREADGVVPSEHSS
jgi:hypothetical protein